jgi:hypothetical protein
MEQPTDKTEEQPVEQPVDCENILKPKRKQTLTDEQRKAKAEHMRKISLERIAKAKLANESKLNEEEDKIIQRLAKVETKKEALKKVKDTQPLPELKKQKAVKKVIMQESSDSEDYDDEDEESEEEVIYVAKKPKKKVETNTMLKKKHKEPVSQIPQEIPKQIIKFL